jgi:anti-sigma B factor antagonist
MTGQTVGTHDTDVTTSPIPLVELILCQPQSRSESVRLAEQVDEVVDLRARHVIVDLAACETLDASVIAVLVDAHRRIRRHGGRLSLRGTTTRVRRLLHLSGVDHVFDLLPAADARTAAGAAK